jgi:fucose permease
MQLARVELRRELATTAKASAALVVAAVGGLLTIVFGSSAAAWGLAQVMATGWAFLIVTLFWLLITSVAGVVGLRKLKQVRPPKQTVRSLKEDVAWAKPRNS